MSEKETTITMSPPPPRRMSVTEYALMQTAEKIRKQAEGRPDLNAYVCKFCHHIRITIDRDAGTTPAMIMCPRCPAVKTIGNVSFPQKPRPAHSLFYKLPPSVTPEMASHEFYRPTYDFYLDIVHTGTRIHIERGGLLLRKIGDVFPVGFEGMHKKRF